MTKPELVAYLSGILSIIDSKEDAGQHRGGWLAEEYQRAYDELMGTVKKEREDEARKSEQQQSSIQDRASFKSDQSGIRRPTW